MDLGRFGEFPGLLPAFEVFRREEMVIATMHLTITGRPRSAGHRVTDVVPRDQQFVRDGRFPSARGRRQNDRERHYSSFYTCSRIRSSSSLIARTSSRIGPSFALLPTVLASRTITLNMTPT